jgi:hypothetical protein
MTDLVQRLRYIHHKIDTTGTWFDADVARPIMHEAANEIERLRKALETARLIIIEQQLWEKHGHDSDGYKDAKAANQEG